MSPLLLLKRSNEISLSKGSRKMGMWVPKHFHPPEVWSGPRTVAAGQGLSGRMGRVCLPAETWDLKGPESRSWLEFNMPLLHYLLSVLRPRFMFTQRLQLCFRGLRGSNVHSWAPWNGENRGNRWSVRTGTAVQRVGRPIARWTYVSWQQETLGYPRGLWLKI